MKRFLWWLFGCVLVVHGLIHLALALRGDPSAGKNAALWGYFGAEGRSWLLSDTGMDLSAIGAFATALVVIATAGFVLAGIAFIRRAELWRGLTVIAAAASVALLALFWQPELLLGIGPSVAAFGLALFWTGSSDLTSADSGQLHAAA